MGYPRSRNIDFGRIKPSTFGFSIDSHQTGSDRRRQQEDCLLEVGAPQKNRFRLHDSLFRNLYFGVFIIIVVFVSPCRSSLQFFFLCRDGSFWSSHHHPSYWPINSNKTLEALPLTTYCTAAGCCCCCGLKLQHWMMTHRIQHNTRKLHPPINMEGEEIYTAVHSEDEKPSPMI